MIDNLIVSTKGGLLLYEYGIPQTLRKQYHVQISRLVCDVLIEDKYMNDNKITFGNTAMHYFVDNELELVFTLFVPNMLNLVYASHLLKSLARCFKDQFTDVFIGTNNGEKPNWEKYNFSETFDSKLQKIVRNVEKKYSVAEIEKEKSPMTPLSPTSALKQSKDQNSPKDANLTPTRKGRREWDPYKITPEKHQELDLSEYVEVSANSPQPGESTKKEQSEKEKVDFSEKVKLDFEIEEEPEEEDDEDVNKYIEQTKEKKAEQKKGFFSSFFSADNLKKMIQLKKTLTREELEPILEEFYKSLIGKNVAEEIANKIRESVAAQLSSRNVSTFSSVKKIVSETLSETLTTILTPNRNIDVLKDILESKKNGKLYSILLCGVNGVGKSTSLAKLCYWLKSNNISVLIAACDTFRSGAVEQLEVHASRLDVPVFSQGYGKNAASVAAEALKKAASDKIDVVLIDTAGRMQDNTNYMQSLTKVILINRPDLVLFVGEALVGNDGVDQLVKFDNALQLYAQSQTSSSPVATSSGSASSNVTYAKTSAFGNQNQRSGGLIDGIILTKFDAIDDKVGASISMTYRTKTPILFVGVGQHYRDLKRLSIPYIVKCLMK